MFFSCSCKFLRARPTPVRARLMSQSSRACVAALASTRAGEVVCRRGESAGYSCAEVELTDYAPEHPLNIPTLWPEMVALNGGRPIETHA